MNTPARPSWALLLSLFAGCGTTGSPTDGGMDAPRDVVVDAFDAGLGCARLATCVNACPDSACVTRCRANASPDGLRLLQAQHDCVFGSSTTTPPTVGACPTTPGGVCDSVGIATTVCRACVTRAQQPGGACDARVMACQRSP